MSSFNNEPKKGSAFRYWHYSNPSVEDYTLKTGGVVIEIGEGWEKNSKTGKYLTWENTGNPIRYWYIIMKNRKSGDEICWTFKPRTSVAAQACFSALDPMNKRPAGSVDLEELLGKIIEVSTQDGVYNGAHPRPFTVRIIGSDPNVPVRGMVDFESWCKKVGVGSNGQIVNTPLKPEPEPEIEPEPDENMVAQYNKYQQTDAYADEDLPF